MNLYSVKTQDNFVINIGHTWSFPVNEINFNKGNVFFIQPVSQWVLEPIPNPYYF